MSKSTRWISILLFLILLTLIGVYAALRVPYLAAKNDLPSDAPLELYSREDGSLLLRWAPSDTADEYFVRVSTHEADAQGERQSLFSALCTQPECVLPQSLPEDVPVDLTIYTQKHYVSLGTPRIRAGENPRTVSCYLNRPKIEDLKAYVDDAHAKVYLSWSGWQEDTYRIFRLQPDGSREPLRTQQRVGAELQFGESGDLVIPAHGETVTFVLDALRETPGLVFYGNLSADVSVIREDFLGRTLLPEYAAAGENRFVLTWNETKGERYEVREIDPATGKAQVLAEIPADGERRYETERLGPFSSHCFEIAALGGETIGGGEIAAQPVRLEVSTREALRYATVWALKDTEILSRPGGGDAVGTMSAARAYCVLEEQDGWFRVGTPAFSGYVEADACMINLPDYIGDLCSYDITNSYSSRYMVHEYEIPKVTDTVVEGYEDTEIARGSYLVPLLYPTAKRLITASEAMAADGYRIKIYDSFRPNRATRSIYDLTEGIMNDPIPEETFTGKPVRDLPTNLKDDEELTYARVMTNGIYGLGSFLASGGSMHNFGIALDLTMESASDRTELEMQTSMHDLSWYSAIARNNDNANLLRRYMLGAGFGGLTSEWWHFQDNEAFSTVKPAIRWAGVSPEGWCRDDAGWRYRLADGTYCRAAERTIDGAAYRFDDNGYVTE